MKGDYIPLVVGLLVFLASIISLRLGLSVAIIEIALGTIVGNLGLKTEEWMLYIAQFGGIILTYLAGTEIDTNCGSCPWMRKISSILTPGICPQKMRNDLILMH